MMAFSLPVFLAMFNTAILTLKYPAPVLQVAKISSLTVLPNF